VVVVERAAADFQLIALPDRLEAVVGEDGAEVRTLAKTLEVNTSVVCHASTATVSYSQQAA
jgi:ribosomal protein S3